ncbi:hypothetical protein [Geminisphaera colitermitum]|uniref:hypothetical protein n=1 Tax=Geminisphaera colitermitum TaxID=1148786 RepID=UPI000158CFD8|nr:hypothetical protein [Geminisphaera colitermitum]
MTTTHYSSYSVTKRLLPSLLLLAGFGFLLLASPDTARAALIFEAGFESGNIVTVGGTGALGSNTAIYQRSLTTANPLGQGSYLHVVKNSTTTSGGYFPAVTFTPTSAANSWAALSTKVDDYVHLNGGADLFFRVNSLPSVYDNWFRPIDLTGGTPTGGVLRIALSANSTNSFNLLISGGSGSMINASGSTVSSISVNGSLAVTTGATASINHIGFTFSTAADGWITAKLFGRTDGGAIDTSGTALATVTFKINSSVVTTGLTGGNFSLLGGSNSGTTNSSDIDYDLFRLYNSAPASFSAIAPIPESATSSVLFGVLGALACVIGWRGRMLRR